MRATVVVPTFDHGATLERSVPTALAQTVSDIEVFVVGDGVPEVTRDIMARFMAEDRRVRFFDNPKGPGNGEVHRAAALREARGRIVAYLSDDDLWMPEHLEELDALLADADFAHAYPIRIEPDGTIADWNVDLSLGWYRRAMLEGGTNFVPLACGGHTLDLYRRLPHGWRARPEGMWSDLYMWQQILSVPGIRAVSGTRPTVLHLPSSLRLGWPVERRLQELDRWVARIGEPGLREDLYLAVAARTARGQARNWEALQEHRAALEAMTEDRDSARVAEGRLGMRQAELVDQLDRLARDREEERLSLEGQLTGARRELAEVTGTRTWRWRGRLLRTPLGGLARRRGAGRSRPGAS
jgi:hypothetical protein